MIHYVSGSGYDTRQFSCYEGQGFQLPGVSRAHADRFMAIDFSKPNLFPGKDEVLRKTGVFRNLVLAALIGALPAAYLAMPSHFAHSREAFSVSEKRADFASPRAGFVTRIGFKEGDFVKKGDTILCVVSPEDKTRLIEAKFGIEALQMEISAEEHETKLLSMKMKEAENLEALGSVHRDAVAEARFNLLAKEKRLSALRAKLRVSKVRRMIIREEILKGKIRAPFSGRLISDIGSREENYVKEGDYLFTLAGGHWVVEALLTEADYSRIEIGAKASVKFYAFPGLVSEGRVAGFKPFAEPSSQSGPSKAMLKAQILLDEVPPGLCGGMGAKVTLEAKSENSLRRLCHEVF